MCLWQILHTSLQQTFQLVTIHLHTKTLANRDSKTQKLKVLFAAANDMNCICNHLVRFWFFFQVFLPAIAAFKRILPEVKSNTCNNLRISGIIASCFRPHPLRLFGSLLFFYKLYLSCLQFGDFILVSRYFFSVFAIKTWHSFALCQFKWFLFFLMTCK